ncbi:hypothetical protein SAMN04489740_4173 [Arthrobacter alpinus]|uniref:Uncharacterized protein n=1 Tax=Arthrobacter alpinus TaxID=656366 RepID=A0A1H5PG32_9MICC|nr:hypothetical protein SAMN04489740_4173 [Arthrobacter alpinus]
MNCRASWVVLQTMGNFSDSRLLTKGIKNEVASLLGDGWPLRSKHYKDTLTISLGPHLPATTRQPGNHRARFHDRLTAPRPRALSNKYLPTETTKTPDRVRGRIRISLHLYKRNGPNTPGRTLQRRSDLQIVPIDK